MDACEILELCKFPAFKLVTVGEYFFDPGINGESFKATCAEEKRAVGNFSANTW